MNIAIVHQYYLMPGSAGGSRFNEFARIWAAAGHNVTVIAGNLDFTTGHVPDHLAGRWCVRERDGEVNVWRCHVPRSYRRSYLGRMWAFAGFTLSAACAALRLKNFDIVIASSPPLIVTLPAWLIRGRTGKAPSRIFEVRDLWPESAVTTGVLTPTSPITRALSWLERWSCATFDRINVLTPAFRDDLLGRQLAHSENIFFVPNGADIDAFRPRLPSAAMRKDLGWGERFVALYAGAHGRANALEQLVAAAEALKHRPDICIACVGDGPERERLKREAARRGLKNIIFHGAFPKTRMPEIISSCDIGLAVLQDNPTFRTVYPNKVFDYMACQRPTVLAIDGIARDLVCEQAEAGVFAKPENAINLAQKIIWMADNPLERQRMGHKGRAWVEKNVARVALAQRYLGIMRDIVTTA